MNTMQKIPIGLARQILKKKYGKGSDTLDDIVLEKIACEKLLAYLKEAGQSKGLLDRVQKQLRTINKKLSAKSDYLAAWYSAYFALASQCNQCSFNHENHHCSFYGEKKMPQLNPNSPNKKCDHFTSTLKKHTSKLN